MTPTTKPASVADAIREALPHIGYESPAVESMAAEQALRAALPRAEALEALVEDATSACDDFGRMPFEVLVGRVVLALRRVREAK